MTAATSVTATFAVNSKAALTSPIPGSVLPGASATFTWSAGSGAAEYFLRVGTTLGGADLYGVSQGLNLSATVTTLPGGSVPIFVRLQTRFGTTWQSTDYTFTGGVLRPGRTHQSHPGEHLQRGSDHIQLERRGRSHGIHRLGGTAPGGQDLYNQSLGLNQFAFVNNLPGGAAPVFVRLITRFGTSEQFTDYTFTGAPFCF